MGDDERAVWENQSAETQANGNADERNNPRRHKCRWHSGERGRGWFELKLGSVARERNAVGSRAWLAPPPRELPCPFRPIIFIALHAPFPSCVPILRQIIIRRLFKFWTSRQRLTRIRLTATRTECSRETE